MKSHALFLPLCAVLGISLCSCTRDLSARLIGTWQSNRELTSQTIHVDVPPEALAQFVSVFGHMRVTFTSETITVHMPALKGEAPSVKSSNYHVIGSNNETLTIQPEDWPETKNIPMVIHFVSADRYWVELQAPGFDTNGWKESFDRVPD